jgi:hypothetical protein
VIESLASENADLRAAVVDLAVEVALMRFRFLRILRTVDEARSAAERRVDTLLERQALLELDCERSFA